MKQTALATCVLAVTALGLGSPARGDVGRHYDLVSPVDKNGVDVQNMLKAADDGSAVAWASLGAYAGTPGANIELAYVGRRVSTGEWVTRSMFPAMSDTHRSGVHIMGGWAFSSSLRSAMVATSAPLSPLDLDNDLLGQGGEAPHRDIYRLQPGTTPTWLSTRADGTSPNELVEAQIVGVSSDGHSAFFRTSEALVRDVAAGSGVEHLYRSRHGQIELVGRGEGGAVLAGGSYLGANGTAALGGGGHTGDLPDSHAVSRDGTSFVFGSQSFPQQVYLHRADGTVRLLSESQASGSIGQPSLSTATFVAAVPDLSVIYFRTQDRLTDDAPSGGGDYRYDVGSGRLSYQHDDLQLATSGLGGFVRVSDDGRYSYFVSQLQLAPGGAAGEFNLYVDGPRGRRFVAPLVPEDNGLTLRIGDTPPFSASGLDSTGAKLVFQSAARITEYDNAGTTQVYLYDAVGERITCVSCDPDAVQSQGSARIGEDSEYIIAQPRVMASDGRRIAFVSEERLVPGDTNDVGDVYEYVDGRQVLISSGTSGFGATLGGMSADGTELFFTTRSRLVDEDIDGGLVDVYTAHLGSPHVTAVSSAPCSGDDCQGPPSERTAIATPPSSVGFADEAAPQGAARVRLLGVSQRERALAARSGRLRVRVAVSGAAEIALSARATINRRARTVARGVGRAARAGTFAITLRLNRVAVRQLAAERPVRLTVLARAEESRSVQRMTLLRTRPAARTGRGKR